MTGKKLHANGTKEQIMTDIIGTLKVFNGDKSYTLQIAEAYNCNLVDEKGNCYEFPAGILFLLFDSWVKGQNPYELEHSGEVSDDG